jgi:alpha-tubulin suppressor-like RCC1 family protein
MAPIVAVAMSTVGAATLLFACASSDEGTPPVVDGSDSSTVDADAGDAATRPDARNDADAETDDGEFEVPDASVQCEVTPCAKSISGVNDGFCVLLDDGHIACWGANDGARLGQDPEVFSIPTPSGIPGLSEVRQVEVAQANSCARVPDGSIYCWGESDLIYAGQTPPEDGDLPWGQFPTPMLEDAVPPGESITIGSGFACVKTSDGSMNCWGANSRLELGRGPTDIDFPAPPAKASLVTDPIASVVAGDGRTFVITPDGHVLSWGTNRSGRGGNLLLGRDTSEDPNGDPTLVPLLSRVRSISTGTTQSCAIEARHVDCWGANRSGQLGFGTFDSNDHLPARNLLDWVTDTEDADAGVDAASKGHDVPVQVAVGRQHACAVLGSGRVYCWGNAGAGRLLGTALKADAVHGTPTRIDGFGGPAVALAAGGSSMCALLRSGAVECWGANDRGQLGNGSVDVGAHPTPSRVSFSN